MVNEIKEQKLRAKIEKKQIELEELEAELDEMAGEERPKKGKILGDPVCELY